MPYVPPVVPPEETAQCAAAAHAVAVHMAAVYEKTGRKPLALVRSYGCQQNVADGEHLCGMLAEMGYDFTESVDEADLILYNTCAVREHAENRIFGNVGALKHQKRRNPDLIVGVCGCMPQQPAITEKLQKSFPYVDLIFGTQVLHRLPILLEELLRARHRVVDISEQNTIPEGLPVRRDGRFKAFVSVMYGCNNFCSYCVVPLVRGRERSRSSEAVLEEVCGLVNEGYREITLLGQNVNSFGKGTPDRNFAQLLRAINEIDGDFRVRFMTSHPRDCTFELIDAIADCEKVCNHIHLPVQSGSDRVLQEMNRHYNVERYLSLIDYARQRIPDVAFTSDIIVGFPGETREDFEQTLELIRRVRYDALFTFIFSPRGGTKAALMEDPVPAETKSEWFRELLAVQNAIGEERYRSYVGTTQRVLLDGEGKTPGTLTGRTEANTIVEVAGSPDRIGQFVRVRILRAMNWAVEGEIL